jgi:hypothetical protein
VSRKNGPGKPYLRAVVAVGETLRRYPPSTAEAEILARAIRAAVNRELDSADPDPQRPLPGEEPLLPKITVTRGGIRFDASVGEATRE